MTRIVVLDSTVVGLLCLRKGIPPGDKCKLWVKAIENAGIEIVLPEIVDYVVRRELIRLGKRASLERLDTIISGVTYEPLTTQSMRLAAELWARARQEGRPTADRHALDGDVILAAQAKLLNAEEVIVATSNVGHLTQFVDAREWQEIEP
jgi:predicted nucleic acid-binding protein